MRKLPRAALPISAALALLVALALTAHAQVLDPSVSVAIAGDAPALGAGQTSVLNGTATNDGQLQGTVTLAYDAPPGWDVALDPSSAFPLAAGASAPFTVTVTAPADATPTDGALAVTATLTDGGGRSTTSAPATVGLAFLPPAPIPPPWYQTPGGIAGIVGAILLVLGIAAYLVKRRRDAHRAADHAAWLDRETGITLALAGGPLQYGHKREVVYRLALTNQSPRPRVALLDLVDPPNGWRASTQLAKVPLSVGETQHVTLVVTPDAVITPGDKANVTVRVKPEEAREKDERLHLEVIAPKHGAPPDPHYRIVTVHREPANVARR